jgi:hypothetical protein
MTKEAELAAAKAITKYLVDKDIAPESIDFIKVKENKYLQITISVILKPLLNINYFGCNVDISSKNKYT